MYLSYLFQPGTPDSGVPNMRLARLQDEPWDTQLKNAGMNVLDALLASVQQEGVALVRRTPVGQQFEGEYQRQAVMDFFRSPLLWVGLIVGALFLIRRR